MLKIIQNIQTNAEEIKDEIAKTLILLEFKISFMIFENTIYNKKSLCI